MTPLKSLYLCLTLLSSILYSQTPINEGCLNGPAMEPAVALTWPDIADARSVATLSSTDLNLILENTTDTPRLVVIEAITRAGNDYHENQLATLNLNGGDMTRLPISLLDGLVADGFSAMVQVRARLYHADGSPSGKSFAPVVFFHADATGGVLAYGDEALRLHFNGGDLWGSYRHLGSNLAGILPASNWEAGPPTNNPNPTLKFCIDWVARAIDSGYGEDYHTDQWSLDALGAHVTVDHANWQQPLDFFADRNNGCIEFETEETEGFIVTVQPWAKLGETGNFQLTTHPDQDDTMLDFVLVANPGVSQGVFNYVVGWEHMPVSEMMAFAAHSFERVDKATSPRYQGNKLIRIHGDVIDDPICVGGCSSSSEIWLQQGRTNQKFGMAHEVGHVIHHLYVGTNLGKKDGNHAYNSGAFECEFTGAGNHAMRSKEYAANAFIEGFAQYIGALSWNNHLQQDGIFVYYKNLSALPQYQDMTDNSNLVELDGFFDPDKLGGNINWLGSNCPTPGFGTEMDWMRFLWNFRTDQGTKPTHGEIRDIIKLTRQFNNWPQATDVFPAHWATVSDPVYNLDHLANRFIVLAAEQGVGN